MSDASSVINPGLIARVKNILMKPAQEWEVIRAESSSVPSLFTGYAMILAAIPAIAGFLGGLFFASMFGALGVSVGLVGGLVGAVIGYVMSLVSVFVLGLIIDALAPQFGAARDRTQAMKVAVYAMTPAWVAGILNLLPALGLLVLIAGLYGLYLLYLGIKQVMAPPTDKAIVYTIVACVVAILLWWVAAVVVASLTAALAISGAADSVAMFG